jgi:hypothetical protein
VERFGCATNLSDAVDAIQAKGFEDVGRTFHNIGRERIRISVEPEELVNKPFLLQPEPAFARPTGREVI